MDESIILAYFRGGLNDDDARRVEAWYEADAENRKIMERVYYTAFIGNCVDAMDSADINKSFERLNISHRNKKSLIGNHNTRRWRYAALVAAFIGGLIFAIGFSYIVLNEPSCYTISTAAGEHAQVVLPDGSRVWLNYSTQLAYKTSLWSRKRHVDLCGEAYFEVARDKHKLFVVNNEQVQVQVLGTKFNVRARQSEEKMVTTLLKGSVLVVVPEKEGLLLKPGQVLGVNTKSFQCSLIESPYAKDVLAWIQKKVVYDRKSLLEIASSLEMLFGVTFHFADDGIKEEQFTCEFKTDDSIAGIMNALSLTQRIQYKIEGQNIYLSAKK